MPKYLIEREMPGAGKLSPDELRGPSAKSCIPADRISEIKTVIDLTAAEKR